MSSAVAERHRASRSGRCIVAAGLLGIMALQTIFAVASAAGNGFALVLNFMLGAVAASLLHSVVTDVRRASAKDRAAAAVRAAAQANERSHEHTSFAVSLGGQLQTARDDVARSRSEAAQWGARTRELEARLSEAEIELAQVRDTLWVSEAAEKRARAELVMAEQQPRHLRPA